MARLALPYAPRRPTETVLYGVVRSHLETFLARARETYEKPLPRYVEQEFRSYLKCGVFAYGFVRCRCDACGHDLLVAYSCKIRGLCPSCSGRRMANTAAHLVDRVLPDVPVRQFVLSLPFELRQLAAFKPRVLNALSRIFVDVVFASYRARAKPDAICGAKMEPTQCGALTFVQRFGGSLNLNLHFHVVFLDGVFTRDDQGRPIFHPAPAPDATELRDIVQRVHDRSVRWLRRRGYVDERPLEKRSNESLNADAIDGCAAIAMQRGSFAKLASGDDVDGHGGDDERLMKMRFAAEHEGFNIHAEVHIAAGDDMGRERLLRYGLRPAFSLERLRRLPGGRIALQVKYARAGRGKHRVMTAFEFLARLCALIPPPRFPLLRYHGVLAPNSSWRKDVVPKPREPGETREGATCPAASRRTTRKPKSVGDVEANHAPNHAPARFTPLRDPFRANSLAVVIVGPSACAPTTNENPRTRLAPILLTPNILSVAHWKRLLDGDLYSSSARVNWSRLMQRTFQADVLECPKCRGRMKIIADICELAVAHAILASLGQPTDLASCARARDPTEHEESAAPDDAA